MTRDATYMAQYAGLGKEPQTTYKDSFDGADLGTDQAAAETAAKAHANLGYTFSGWKEEAVLSDADDLMVTATAQYAVTSVVAVVPRSFPAGKPKGSITIALPVSYQLGKEGDPVYSDALAESGKRAEKYTGKQTPADFNQSALSGMGVEEMYIELDAFDGSDPVTAASLPRSYVVKGGENQGYAAFDGITIKSSATNGFYTLTGVLYWKMRGATLTNSVPFSTQIRVTGASSSSGGSSYGGGSSTSGSEKPQAKLVVEAITTDPLRPKAGDSFDVVLCENTLDSTAEHRAD
jgi:hypothetical protein